MRTTSAHPLPSSSTRPIIRSVEDGPADERNDQPAADQGEAAYRGFLFADLRGYTAFVESHGDAAAADLLDAYRELVRDEVARHAGAEIRTEGDSFYVVFGSARRAVACGLAIVAAAERASREHRERPIRVGIGINAGETVQRGEGFVGTAVNLAARVCAQAREGEVLITPAVRDAVGAAAGLRLIARGTHRLKGIARPVPLFAVRPATATEQRRALPAGPPWLPIAAGLVAVSVVAAVLWISATGVEQRRPDGSPGAAVAPSAVATVAPTVSQSPAPDPNAFPNALEASLLAALDEDSEEYCERADEDDRPVMLLDAATAQAFGITSEERAAAHIGIACEEESVLAPDTFHLWVTRQIIDFRAVDVGEALILNRAGRLGIPLGDCGQGGPAYERWEVGDLGGWLLCNESFGDAIIEWSYDDRAIFGRAVRRDGDLASLLAWWDAEAKLLRP